MGVRIDSFSFQNTMDLGKFFIMHDADIMDNGLLNLDFSLWRAILIDQIWQLRNEVLHLNWSVNVNDEICKDKKRF